MKMLIEWHQECAANLRRWVTSEAKRVAKMQDELIQQEERLAQQEERLALYERQVNEAMRRGLLAFDREKFLHKRGKP